MDENHRKLIRKNIVKLVQHTSFEDLRNECLRERLLSQQMVENIYKDSKELYDGEVSLEDIQHQKLFEKITQRGPDAYEKLITILTYLDNVVALQILSRKVEFNALNENGRKITERSLSIVKPSTGRIQTIPLPVETSDIPDNMRAKVDENFHPILEEYLGTVKEVKYEVKKSDRIHTNVVTGTYKMQSKEHRGVLFIANFINTASGHRSGALYDSEALICVFKQMGFKIFVTTDSSQKEFFELLDKLLESDYSKQTECFILALMSHGQMKDNGKEVVEFSDGSIAEVETISDRFSNVNCPNLYKKPKVLIFPFCRGHNLDSGVGKVETDTIRYTMKSDNLIATVSDLLICYATTPGFKSHRNSCTGSWYIQELCNIIAQYAHNTPFEDILKKVHADVGEYRSEYQKMQMGNSISFGFNRNLFFNPGYSED